MNLKYTRLKLRMLLMVVAGTILAVSLGLFIVKTATGQAVWHERPELFLLGVILVMLTAFYLAMSRFTYCLKQVGKATRQVVSASAEALRLPRELSPLEGDLKAIQVQLRERQEAAREAEQRKQDLIAFLAHDLKTPLTSVVGYLTLLDNGPDLDAAQRAKYTGIALEKARRLEELLGEFFDITRMDLGVEEADMEPIRLTVLLEQLSDEFYPLFTEKNLRCETEIQHHLVVLGDPDKLARVFDNVLRNAVSYSVPGGVVQISAHSTDGRVEVTIGNEGLEIPEVELSRIFQKFYRLDAARSTRTGGAGLGLAIAKEIVERHGGAIRAESTGKHTRFVILLPEYTEGN